ncbi:MAG TPA: hypothetical protein PK718_03375 [Candidatus Methanofastidiosa archaeon]|nr:hypothetical protein [Candidatus Methanofastidiosa archaeon]HPR41572.1 hypothetical protein [Candidatus Methanofastidiosa archaeon]
MEGNEGKIEQFNVRDIAPYKEEQEKATEHVAKVIDKSFEETDQLIKEGRVFLLINTETEECWFEVI